MTQPGAFWGTLAGRRVATDTSRHNGWHGAIPPRVARLRADPAQRLRLARSIAEALGPDRRDRRFPRQVRRRPPQVQVPFLDVRLGGVLRLAGWLVVRDRPDLPVVRAR